MIFIIIIGIVLIALFWYEQLDTALFITNRTPRSDRTFCTIISTLSGKHQSSSRHSPKERRQTLYLSILW